MTIQPTRIRLARILALSGIVAALLLAACGAPAANTTDAPTTADEQAGGADDPALDRSGSGGTLVIGMSAGNLPYPNTPPNEGFEGRRFVGYQIYDGLANYNLDQGEEVPTPQPGLAESWSVDDDQVTWTFNLRQGVKFHDGTDFNADAVIFQFDRIMNEEFEYFDAQLFAANRSNTAMIESYRKVDPYTVEVTTVSPYAFLPWEMTFILFPSPQAVMTYGNDQYVNYATGTGPFRMTRYIDGQVMELEPYEEYWGGKPRLDKIVLRPMPDPATRLAALQSGDIDWAEVPPPDSLEQLRSQGYTVLLKQYPHGINITLDISEPPFDNPQVREALQYAIDRENLCERLLNGLCVPSYQYFYEGHPWHNPELSKQYSYDPEKARALLAEAGYPDGFAITIAYPTGGSGNMWPGQMMEFVQSNFRDVGVNMEIVPLEWNNIISIFRSGLQAPENQAYDGMYISPGPVSPTSLYSFASFRIPPEGCCNAAGYSSPVFDELIVQAQEEFDQQRQNELLREAISVVAEDSPVIFMVHDLNFRVLSPNVRGFVQPQTWFADLRNVWIKE